MQAEYVGIYEAARSIVRVLQKPAKRALSCIVAQAVAECFTYFQKYFCVGAFRLTRIMVYYYVVNV